MSRAAVVLAQSGAGLDWPTASPTGPSSIDPMSLGLRWLALLVGLVFTLIAARLADEDLASEYFGCLMLVVVGVMLTASANELVLLFLGLELISIPTYVLLFLGRRDRASGEATMKYFFLSILSSALLLYGFSFLYGLGKTTLIAGTADHPGIREALACLPLGQSARAARAAGPGAGRRRVWDSSWRSRRCSSMLPTSIKARPTPTRASWPSRRKSPASPASFAWSSSPCPRPRNSPGSSPWCWRS